MFFSFKVTCSICEKECGLHRFQIKDKLWVCPKCFKAAGLTLTSPIRTMTPDVIKDMIVNREENAKKLAALQITKQVANFLKIDEEAQKWYIPNGGVGSIRNPQVHSYDEILNFELLEDGGSIFKGGLGSAVVGGVLFGNVGAIIGGTTGKRKGESTCNSLKIKITLNNMTTPTEYINLITTETKKSSIFYEAYEKQAQEILSLFQVMYESNKVAQSAPMATVQVQSVADEIVKFKQLFDNGIITEEEFEAKKKQLLGI